MADDIANPDNVPSPSHQGLRKGSQDLLAGMLCLTFAGLSFYLVQELPMTRGTRIGAGYMPKALIGIIGLIALILIVRGLAGAGERVVPDRLRPIAFVIASFIVFGLLISRAGFFMSCFALVAVACMADPRHKPLPVLALATGLAAVSSIVFVKLLQVPVSIFP